MAGEVLLTSDGKLRLRPTGDLVLVPEGGLDELAECCCGGGGDPGGDECTCRRMYRGLNYIYQQDARTRHPDKDLASLYDPIYRSAFTSSSNDVNTADVEGTHRCWMQYVPTSDLPDPVEGVPACEEAPDTEELCINCPGVPTGSGTLLARPCGWYEYGQVVCACRGAEALAPIWTWIGRVPFTARNVNHCIRSALLAGTLTGGDPDESPPVGQDPVCEEWAQGYCPPVPGNLLRVTITVGSQSLVVWGRWFGWTVVVGEWFWRDAVPLLTDAAWSDLPNHRGSHHFTFVLRCVEGDGENSRFSISGADSPGDLLSLFPALATSGTSCPGNAYGWVDADEVAYIHGPGGKSWLIPWTATSWTINDFIKPETPFGGTGDPAVPLTIELQWLTIP